jgi:hypothetical protein
MDTAMRTAKEYFVRFIITFILVLSLLAAGFGAGMWKFVPQRWNEPLVNLSRAQVHMVLGFPDTDAFANEAREEWHESALVGAWVLSVYYDKQAHVVRAEQEFAWGPGYLLWGRDYRYYLEHPDKVPAVQP